MNRGSNKDEWITADFLHHKKLQFSFLSKQKLHSLTVTGNTSHIHTHQASSRSDVQPRPAHLNRPWDLVPRPFLRAASLLACSLAKRTALQHGAEPGLAGRDWKQSVVGWVGAQTRLSVPLHNRAHGETWGPAWSRGVLHVTSTHPHPLGPAANRQAAWLMAWYFPQVFRSSVRGGQEGSGK
jgi:hypothetical protein